MSDAYIERRKTGELAAAISPEILAAKLAAIRNLEYLELARQFENDPTTGEKLWSIQFESMRPGGLNRYAERILENHSDQIGTETLLTLGWPRFGKYNLEVCLNLWQAHRPRSLYSKHLFGTNFSEWAEMVEWNGTSNEGNDELLELYLEGVGCDRQRPSLKANDAKAIRAGSLQVRNWFANGMRKFNFRHFHESCEQTARRDFAHYLASLCNEVSKPFSPPWYCPNFSAVLSAAMRSDVAAQKERLAMTAVADKVFDAFEFAWEERSFVQIFGDSRFGKTRSSGVWCSMYPGRFRLVRVPPGNSVNDLVRGIADALGINYTSSTNRNSLREKVEYVLRHGGLGLAFDEAQFLAPVTVSENTPPQRLDWIRTHILDNGNPCVLLMTPQSHGMAFKKFVKKTQYAIEQWTGRIGMTVVLPKELDFQDLVTVAKKSFPEIDQDYLELIASKSMQSESYLKAVEDIAKRARFLARKANRPEVGVEDIESAIHDVMPVTIGPRKPMQLEKTCSLRDARKPDAKPPREVCNSSSKVGKAVEKLSDFEARKRLDTGRPTASDSPCLVAD